jgi:cytidylate kinase
MTITITVEGPWRSGKTTAAAYIAEVLSRLGAETSLHDIDIDDEDKQIAAVSRARAVLAGTTIRVLTKQQPREPSDEELGTMGG